MTTGVAKLTSNLVVTVKSLLLRLQSCVHFCSRLKSAQFCRRSSATMIVCRSSLVVVFGGRLFALSWRLSNSDEPRIDFYFDASASGLVASIELWRRRRRRRQAASAEMAVFAVRVESSLHMAVVDGRRWRLAAIATLTIRAARRQPMRRGDWRHR